MYCRSQTFHGNQSFTKEELYYTGRVLDTTDFTIAGRLNNVMKDLTSISFCVPVAEKYSPVAYAIVNDVHWHHKWAMHSGIETTLRYVNRTAFIIEGRAIVKLVKKNCQRCRYLAKRTVDVAMRPVSQHNLTIALAFYVPQVDLCGPKVQKLQRKGVP